MFCPLSIRKKCGVCGHCSAPSSRAAARPLPSQEQHNLSPPKRQPATVLLPLTPGFSGEGSLTPGFSGGSLTPGLLRRGFTHAGAWTRIFLQYVPNVPIPMQRVPYRAHPRESWARGIPRPISGSATSAADLACMCGHHRGTGISRQSRERGLDAERHRAFCSGGYPNGAVLSAFFVKRLTHRQTAPHALFQPPKQVSHAAHAGRVSRAVSPCDETAAAHFCRQSLSPMQEYPPRV